MKATDVNIMDWVCNKLTFEQFQIKRIHTNCVMDVSGRFLDLAYVIPLKLTEDILEKNGFVFTEPNFMTLSEENVWHIEGEYATWEIDLEPQEDENGGMHFATRMYNGYNNCEIWITYVHQLQHAIRLCGIDKEITI